MKRLTGAFALGAVSLFMLTSYLQSDLDAVTPSKYRDSRPAGESQQ